MDKMSVLVFMCLKQKLVKRKNIELLHVQKYFNATIMNKREM